MLSREDVELTLQRARKYGGYGLDQFFESLLQHDAEQRAELDKKDHEIQQIREHEYQQGYRDCEAKKDEELACCLIATKRGPQDREI